MPKWPLALVWLLACSDADEISMPSLGPGPGPALEQPAGPLTTIPIGKRGEQPGGAPCVIQGCGDGVQALSVDGASPYGPVHIASAGVYYLRGDAAGTGVRLVGTLAGQPLELLATVRRAPSAGGTRPACNPGRYREGPQHGDLSVRFASCGTGAALRQVELVVTRHVAPTEVAAGAPVLFAGQLTVRDPGWSLQVPLDVRAVCEIAPAL